MDREALTIEDIKSIVEQINGVELSSKTRTRQYVDARFIYFHLADTYARKVAKIAGVNVKQKYSLTDIGRLINRDHSTVIHGIKKAKTFLSFDRVFADMYDSCELAVRNKIRLITDRKVSLDNIIKDLSESNVLSYELECILMLAKEIKKVEIIDPSTH